jgi:formate hydrogenlyase subunit 6/NADH:ubiquinone oxidoreductase subunit I
MKLGVMLSDVLNSLFKKPVTQKYPFERTATPERLRGKLVYDPAKCSGCMLCVKDCPSNAIELVTIDRAAKRFVMRYHIDRCTYCSQCVENCRFECLGMDSKDWEMAVLDKKAFEVHYGREEDIEKLLHPAPAPAAPEAAPKIE